MNPTFSLDRIFLYGPPACGKSSLGQRLAQQLALPFYDLDDEISAASGIPIPQIFAQEGESGFRVREHTCLAQVLERPAGVIALGGGALLDAHSRTSVEAAGQVLCLRAGQEVLATRLKENGSVRPLLGSEGPPDAVSKKLAELLSRRETHYASFPLQLETSTLTLEQASRQAQARLGVYQVEGMGKPYAVRIFPGALDWLGSSLRQAKLNGPVALVSDDVVGPLYAARAEASLAGCGYAVHTTLIPAGENHKTIQTVTGLCEAFLAQGLERGSTVVALGGGVVSDLAGFAAAIYLRGAPWVVVPTTLLAMADASLGGKTGADLPQGKNLVGAFHPPSLVLADPDLLSTLPEAELRSGLGEVVKHGLISDPELFALCRRGWEALCPQLDAAVELSELVRRAMAVKIRVIQADPFEKGERAALNLGHTIGHAVEQATHYAVRHGEAVAIGLVAEARLSERLGLAQPGLSAEIAACLTGLGLPTVIPANISRADLLAALQLDKKKRDGTVRFALPLRLGEVQVGVSVDLNLI